MKFIIKSKSVYLQSGLLLILLFSLIKCNNPKTEGIKSGSQGEEIKPVHINGEPRFIIGSYHNPKELNELKILAENGYNLVRSAA
ncbi:MAG: hypothetical protein KAQ79_21080, partial [Cyclobacteriaceae bacterium]|nr:hypothetical protein [Cyclobacteriaceae bacterium]